MGSTAELIWKEFGKKCNLYEVLGVSKTANEKEITSAYRRQALRYHPDKHRGNEASKVATTAKFQAISAIHALLSDPDARAMYDETGTIAPSDEDDNFDTGSLELWTKYFANLFPKVTMEEIQQFENKYRFSEEERVDVMQAYTTFKGDMVKMMETIMLSTSEDEERFAEMIKKELETNKKLKVFPKWREYIKKHANKSIKPESDAKKRRRIAKEEKEALEAQELLSMILGNPSGAPAKRERDFTSLISNLEAKYTSKTVNGKGKNNKKALCHATDPFLAADEPSEEEFMAAQARLMKKK